KSPSHVTHAPDAWQSGVAAGHARGVPPPASPSHAAHTPAVAPAPTTQIGVVPVQCAPVGWLGSVRAAPVSRGSLSGRQSLSLSRSRKSESPSPSLSGATLWHGPLGDSTRSFTPSPSLSPGGSGRSHLPQSFGLVAPTV